MDRREAMAIAAEMAASGVQMPSLLEETLPGEETFMQKMLRMNAEKRARLIEKHGEDADDPRRQTYWWEIQHKGN